MSTSADTGSVQYPWREVIRRPRIHEKVRSIMGLSNNIRNHRLKNGEMTQKHLAERVGVSRQTMNAIENCRHPPTVDVAIRIADVFGITVDTLFDLDYDGRPARRRKQRRSPWIDQRPPLRNRSKSRVKTNWRRKKLSKGSVWRVCAASSDHEAPRCSTRNLAPGRPSVGSQSRASSEYDGFNLAGEILCLPRHYQPQSGCSDAVL